MNKAELLTSLKVDTESQFTAKALNMGLDGNFIRLLWEHREKIIEFVLMLVALLNQDEGMRSEQVSTLQGAQYQPPLSE